MNQAKTVLMQNSLTPMTTKMIHPLIYIHGPRVLDAISSSMLKGSFISYELQNSARNSFIVSLKKETNVLSSP